MEHDLLIIGAGAAGLISAISSKDRGMDVALLEKNDRIGKKILATGNGRCNITNKYINKAMYHSTDNSFFEVALNKFDAIDTEAFFLSIGLPLVCLDEGKLYPRSLQSSSVLDIFMLTLQEKNIPLYLNCKIKSISKINNKFEIITYENQIFRCNKLIISTGGNSAPHTGSDGTGYSLAKTLGHKIITPLPGLVQLKLDYQNLKALSGVKFNGIASIYYNNNLLNKETGEILFTDYGISGPPILQLSRTVSIALNNNKKITLFIDMIPDITESDLKDFLDNHWSVFSYRSVFNSLIGIINKKLIPILLKEAGIFSIHKPSSDLDWCEKKNILRLLKQWEFNVSNTNTFKDAQVTLGGVCTKEIDPSTLESKIVPNLYFAGEILDVDGACGGFNLQWAWSSGYIAGKSASTAKDF